MLARPHGVSHLILKATLSEESKSWKSERLVQVTRLAGCRTGVKPDECDSQPTLLTTVLSGPPWPVSPYQSSRDQLASIWTERLKSSSYQVSGFSVG